MKLTVRRHWDGTYDGSPEEKFEYSCEVPSGLPTELYWLIAQGLLFRNDWTNTGLQWVVLIEGSELK